MKKTIILTGMLIGAVLRVSPAAAQSSVTVDFDQLRVADGNGSPVTEDQIQVTYSEAELAITLCMIAEEYRAVNENRKACTYYEMSLSLRPHYERAVKGYEKVNRELPDNGEAVRVSLSTAE